jgi:hypothetical protein
MVETNTSEKHFPEEVKTVKKNRTGGRSKSRRNKSSFDFGVGRRDQH